MTMVPMDRLPAGALLAPGAYFPPLDAFDPTRIDDVTGDQLHVGDLMTHVAGTLLPVPVHLDQVTADDDRKGMWLSAPEWAFVEPIAYAATVTRIAPVWLLDRDDDGTIGVYGTRQAALAKLKQFAEDELGVKDPLGGNFVQYPGGSAILEVRESWLEITPNLLMR